MTDADVDGAHIRTLLLTFFFRHYPAIINSGYLYIAQPPLFRMQVGKEVQYAYNDNEREEFLAEKKGQSVYVQRYKGLGEMNPSQLWETTMDPKNRVMNQGTVNNTQKNFYIFFPTLPSHYQFRLSLHRPAAAFSDAGGKRGAIRPQI